jgi:ABC-type bacteriocin/lantibiotic exporter with double-glycine peptidase domain
MILVYYGIEIRTDDIMENVKTSEEGTPIKGIMDVATEYDLKTISKIIR